MVLILDGNSKMDAYVRSNLCYLIFLRRDLFSVMPVPELPSNINTMEEHKEPFLNNIENR